MGRPIRVIALDLWSLGSSKNLFLYERHPNEYLPSLVGGFEAVRKISLPLAAPPARKGDSRYS